MIFNLKDHQHVSLSWDSKKPFAVQTQNYYSFYLKPISNALNYQISGFSNLYFDHLLDSWLYFKRTFDIQELITKLLWDLFPSFVNHQYWEYVKTSESCGLFDIQHLLIGYVYSQLFKSFKLYDTSSVSFLYLGSSDLLCVSCCFEKLLSIDYKNLNYSCLILN